MRAIRSNEHGIATMEFALLAPMLMLFLFGLLELAWVQSARSALESSTMKAARQIAASDCPELREKQMISTILKGMAHVKSSNGELPKIEVKSYAGEFGRVGEPEPFIDNAPKNGKFDVGESYTDVNGSGAWEADMGKKGSVGDANEVVSYTVTYRVNPLVPWLATQLGDPVGDYPIKATTVIRNEPVFRTTGCPKV